MELDWRIWHSSVLVYGNSVLCCFGPAIQNSTKQNVNHVPCEWYRFIYTVL